ncbi:MAG: isoprenylcysteine carboxylmethyltransferase family protein [Pseudomonadota bacterium]
MDTGENRANRIPWPPIILISALIDGFLLNWLAPWARPVGWISLWFLLGAALIAGGVGLVVWAARTFQRDQTTISPIGRASALTTSGPFRFSRNPIYLADVMIIAGFGFAFGILWFFPLAILAGILIRYLAISGEERHLEARFGEDWLAYKGRVRRWI